MMLVAARLHSTEELRMAHEAAAELTRGVLENATLEASTEAIAHDAVGAAVARLHAEALVVRAIDDAIALRARDDDDVITVRLYEEDGELRLKLTLIGGDDAPAAPDNAAVAAGASAPAEAPAEALAEAAEASE
eukprot:374014-Prymnesium_polylepis.1